MSYARIVTITLLLSIVGFKSFAVVGPITGTTALCTGTTSPLSDTTLGGVWSSANPAVATISSGGIVTGISVGTATITYMAGFTAGDTVTTTVTVNLAPAAVTGAVTICPGSATTLSDASPGGTWSSSTVAVATVAPATGSVTGISPGTAIISYTSITGCSAALMITVNALPAPISGPSSVCSGATITDSGFPSGGAWSSSSPAIASVGSASGIISGLSVGTTTITYSLGTGCSVAHIVSVNPLPAIFFVSGGGSYCAGGVGVPVGLDSSVAGISYQEYSGGTTIGPAVTGTGGALDFGTELMAGSYTVLAMDPATTCAIGMAGVATISINPLPTIYSLTGGGSYCIGSPAPSIELSGSDAGISYSLYDGATPVTTLPGTGAIVDFGPHTAGSYSVIATNATTGCIGTMGSETVTTNPLPTMYYVWGGGSYCPGGIGADVRLSGSGTGINYLLYKDGAWSGSTLAGTGGILDFGPQTATGSYSLYTIVAVSSSTGCTRNMGGTDTVSLSPLPAVYTVTGGGSYCAGGSGVPVGLDGSAAGVHYQLVNGSSPVGLPLSGTGGSLDFGLQTAAGAYTVVASSATTGCSVNMAGTAVVGINPAPAAYAVTGGGGYCAGGPGVNVSLAGSDAGMSYQLYLGTTAVGAPIMGTGLPVNFGYRTAAGAYKIIAVNDTTACTGIMADSVTVVVNPLPTAFTVTSSPTAVCSGSAGPHINLSGSQSSTEYKLYQGLIFVDSISGTGGALDFGPVTTATPGSYSYSAVATNSVTGCSAAMSGTGSVLVSSLPAVYTVTGGGSYCSGGTGVAVGLSASTISISYKLYKDTSLIAGPIYGTGSPISFGPQTLAGAYTVVALDGGTGCTSYMASSATVTINPVVTPSVSMSIAPGDTVCAGTPVIFTAIPVNGGASPLYQWYVNSIAIAGSTAPSFAFTSLADGDVIMIHLVSSAPCASTATASSTVIMHVITVPAITGAPDACIGGSTSLSDTLTGGIWSSSNPSVATVSTVGGSTGVVTGVAAGTAAMTYTLSGTGCFTTEIITVNALPSITATASSVNCGGAYDLTAGGGATYSWSPSTGLACTTCAATTANPLATTTYTVTGYSTAGCPGTASVSLNGNRISGFISYAGLPTDTMKVWLIQFNPADSSLIAVDSTLSCMDGGAPYYEFDSIPAGSYMVKARLLGTVPGATGYIPTYSLSSPYWYDAASTAHTTATDTMHINMVYGTIPPGPGFIGGLISAGAGRGTAGDVPAQGMLVYLVDAISHFVLTYTYTDDSGAYSFSNIAYGNYIISPEAFSFTTIPSSVVMLSGTADSATGVNFRQYNDSRIIRPVERLNGVQAVTAGNSSDVTVFPNPTTGLLNIVWGAEATGNASVVISDMAGRSVFAATIDIDAAKPSSQAAGRSQIDLEGVSDGIYLMSIKSGQISYSGKVSVENGKL